MDNIKNKRRIICSPLVHRDTAETLASMGFELLFSCENKAVAPPLAYHADIQLCDVKNGFYVSSPECCDYYKNIVGKDRILCGNTYLSCNYPGDIAYNILVGTSCAIGNFRYADSILLQNLGKRKLINISQGYANCTICRISEEGYITSDKGTYKSLISEGFDVLLIGAGGIVLKGYDYGFIGGSSVMLSSDILAVNGDAKSHADYDNIRAFCRNYGVSVLSLSSEPIEDIGSFLII